MIKLDSKWIRQRRAELLAKCSDAEKVAYHNLLMLGYKPIRQFPISTGRKLYFADLYIQNLKLIIEIDGGYHNTNKQKRLDNNRSANLRRLGYHIYRLCNSDARSAAKLSQKIESLQRKRHNSLNKY